MRSYGGLLALAASAAALQHAAAPPRARAAVRATAAPQGSVDVAVIGGGPAGYTIAALLAREELSVALHRRAQHKQQRLARSPSIPTCATQMHPLHGRLHTGRRAPHLNATAPCVCARLQVVLVDPNPQGA